MQKLLIPVIIAAGILSAACVEAQMGGDHGGPVMNYHRIDGRLATGGHLVDDGLNELKAEGIEVVVDLRDEPPEGEQQRYREQGIKWINVPIVWRDPQLTDFESFAKIMRGLDDKHVLVQCQANYRASALTYLYRVMIDDVPDEEAIKDMRTVWDPREYETWDAFITQVKSTQQND